MKKQFIFDHYNFDIAAKTLSLTYGFDDDISFTETYRFDFDYIDVNEAALTRACEALFYMAGVSYYKAFLAKEIVIKNSDIDRKSSHFFSKTYQRGLGEYFYVNELDPHMQISFPVTHENLDPIDLPETEGLLIGIGGGKDSLVSVELLRDHEKVATWSVGHRSQLEPLIKTIDLPHFWVERRIDPLLIELNKQGALNGHIPISAVLSCVGVIIAVLTGYQDVVVSNENSANEPTLSYQGMDINHQYSKSLEYEKDFQAYLDHHFGQSIRYYSFLRPLSEVHIAEIFARVGFGKYEQVFSSCNRAFTQGNKDIFWCGECSKCAFTFLAFTPFIHQGQLEGLFHDKNLLRHVQLEPTYRNLLGIEGEKPLDCVGEIKESREAMRLAQKHYPELRQKYQFDIPEDYSYKTLSGHSMPENINFYLNQAL